MKPTTMSLTSWKLVWFRLVLMVLGPWPRGSKLIRALLMRLIRRKGRIAYVAHADFFDVRQAGLESTSLHPHGSSESDL